MPQTYLSAFTGGHNDEYDIRITALEDDVQNLEDNKVNKSGDTMSGTLYNNNASFIVNNSNIITNTVPSSTVNSKGFWIKDSIGNNRGWMRVRQDTSGTEALLLETGRTIGSSTYYNTLSIGLTNNGSCYIGVSDQVAWCKALGIPKILRGNANLTAGTANITFSSAFGSAPTVLTCAHGDGSAAYPTWAGSITATGCKLHGRTLTANTMADGTFNVRYVAIGPWP